MKLTVQIALGFLIIFFCFNSQAQDVAIKVLQQGISYSDSSYYDIMPVEDKFWIGGKYGTLKSIDTEGNLTNIAYPSQQLDIYKLDKFNKQSIIACGDKGIIYKHNLQTKAWQTIKIKGYENACFYNMVVVSESEIYVCGGRSAIAHSKKTVPNGFILKSVDGGLTWKKIYSNPFKMVWCVKYNPFNKKVYALVYTLNKTHLYELEGENWKRKSKIGNSIFHEVQFVDEENYVITGGWMGKVGRIYSNSEKKVLSTSGLIWGRVEGNKYDIYSASNGQIVLGDKSGNYQVHGVKLNKAFNIYETVFTSDTTAIAIGSARTVLLIKITDKPKLVMNNI